jgi:hypothetical protein
MTSVGRIFYKVKPPRSKLRILYVAILQLELEVSINGNKLGIYPAVKKISDPIPGHSDRNAHLFAFRAESQSSGRFRLGWGQAGHSIANDPGAVLERVCA